MANQAKVTSLEALDAFRSRLIVFMAKAKRALDDTVEEGTRMRQYLQHDQRAHWDMERRVRLKKLEQAEQELLSARLTGHQQAEQTRQMVVNRWKGAVAEAEAKLQAVKKWSMNFDNAADPVFRRLEEMRQCVEIDLPKAAAFLANAQKALEAYAEPGGAVPSGSASSAPATAPKADAAPNQQKPQAP